MDQRQRLAGRIEAAERALATLNELELSPKATAIERDAAIKRFEYSYDTIWTAARQFLLAAHGIDERSPKGVIRASRTMALLADDEAVAAINMANDRNLTVHTYNEELALEVFARLATYIGILETWLDAMQRGTASLADS